MMGKKTKQSMEIFIIDLFFFSLTDAFNHVHMGQTGKNK
jgi:hypothetical protein